MPKVVRGDLGSAIDSFARRFVPFGFSGQILVAVDGRVVLHRAYGIADRASRRPMTRQTVVGLASTSKQFTAAAVLKLAQEGRLSLDDPIGRWLEDVPAEKRGITVEQLLTHTSGVGVGVAEDFRASSRREQVRAILDAPLTQDPEEGWRYSNGGYILAAAVVEEAAGTPYESYLREALFGPAGMTHTGFLHAPPEGVPVARAYSGWEGRGAPGEWPENWRAFGSGDLVSTASDLWRWDRALRAGRILSPDWLERYFTPQVEIGDTHGYAYGLFVHEEDEGTVLEHGGDTRLGYNVGFFRYPDRDALLILTANASLSPGRWIRHTLSPGGESLIMGGDPGAEPPAARLPTTREADRLAGSYGLDGGGMLHVVHDGTLLWVAAEGQRATDVLRGRETGSPAVAGANGKTRALLKALRGGGPRCPDAYPAALTAEGRPDLHVYVDEWEGLEAALGPFERFEVLGSVPFRRDVATTARLRFTSGRATMTCFWDAEGRGRLVGSHAVAGSGFPVVRPAAVGPGGELVVHDPWRKTTLRADVATAGGSVRLRFEGGPSARRRGVAGWTP